MNNQFDMLNEVNNDIDNIEEVILSDEEKKKISNRAIKKIKKSNKGFNKKGIIAATLALALTGSLVLTNENVLAQINSIGRKIESFLRQEDDSFKQYKKDIMQVSEDKGIKFMLNEVLLDDEELYISASVDYKGFDRSTLKTKYDGDLNIIPSAADPKFEISLNGEKLDVTGAGGSYEYNDDGTVDMLLKLDMKNVDLNKVYDIKLEINTMETQPDYKDHEFIAGNWILEFKVDGNAMSKEMRIIEINKDIDLEYKGMKIPVTIDELRISPISIRLKYKEDPIERMENNMYLDFKFLDENDKTIDFISQGGNLDGLSYKYIIDREIHKIKVVPIIIKYNRLWNTKKEFKDKAIEITIN